MRQALVVTLLALIAGPGLDAQTDDRMAQWSRALGVECAHCHTGTSWTDGTNPAFAFAQRMERMVQRVNQVLDGVGGVSCWTCHRGATRPPRLPRSSWEHIQARHRGDFSGLPESTGLRMSVYAASLGVECSHCHDPENWQSSIKPPHQLVRTMGRLFDEIPSFFEASRMPVLQCYMCHQGSRQPPR